MYAIILPFVFTSIIHRSHQHLHLCQISLHSVLCPVTAYKTMRKLVPASSLAPAFVLPTSKGLSPMYYHSYQTFLRNKLSELGLPAQLYSSHSFRRGGATFAFKCAVPGELIKQHGDWSSAAYLSYLNFSMDQKVNVSKRLANRILNFH